MGPKRSAGLWERLLGRSLGTWDESFVELWDLELKGFWVEDVMEGPEFYGFACSLARTNLDVLKGFDFRSSAFGLKPFIVLEAWLAERGVLVYEALAVQGSRFDASYSDDDSYRPYHRRP